MRFAPVVAMVATTAPTQTVVEIATAGPEPMVGTRNISMTSHVSVAQIGQVRQTRSSTRSSEEMPGGNTTSRWRVTP